MKNVFLAILIVLGMTITKPAKAQFSTDAPILLEILGNSVSQLYQLMAMVRSTRSNLYLLRDINQGLDSALGVYQTLAPPNDPGLYQEWRNIGMALKSVQRLYGTVANTAESKVQRNIDMGVAEAIQRNNEVYKYSDTSDQIGQRLEQRAESSSPKGAQKLVAQGTGFLIQVQSQSNRTQASQLKLQAQALARENRKDKEHARRVKYEASTLKAVMKNSQTTFQTPRL